MFASGLKISEHCNNWGLLNKGGVNIASKSSRAPPLAGQKQLARSRELVRLYLVHKGRGKGSREEKKREA